MDTGLMIPHNYEAVAALMREDEIATLASIDAYLSRSYTPAREPIVGMVQTPLRQYLAREGWYDECLSSEEFHLLPETEREGKCYRPQGPVRTGWAWTWKRGDDTTRECHLAHGLSYRIEAADGTKASVHVDDEWRWIGTFPTVKDAIQACYRDFDQRIVL